MEEKIIIREARSDDYPSFRKMEEIAWAGTGIKPIEEDMFLTWLDVFPEGLLLALKDDVVVGHLYGQICDFDPLNKTDNRNLNEMTDSMYTIKTHNPKGNCIYIVSISAIFSGAGIKLINKMIELALEINKKYFAGTCRIPGLSRYLKSKSIDCAKFEDVERYVRLVLETIKKKRKS